MKLHARVFLLTLTVLLCVGSALAVSYFEIETPINVPEQEVDPIYTADKPTIAYNLYGDSYLYDTNGNALYTYYADNANSCSYADSASDAANSNLLDNLDSTAFARAPSSSTDNAIARFDGTTGKLIQNSGVTISDTNVLTATSFSGGGGSLTGLNANNLGTGTIPSARFSTSVGAYSFDPIMPKNALVHNTLGYATIGEIAISKAYTKNKMQFELPLAIEWTNDSGVNWNTYPDAVNSTTVKNMLLGYNTGAGVNINGTSTGNWTALRITWNKTVSYDYLNYFYVYQSTQGNYMKIIIQRSNASDINDWITVANSTEFSSWPGHAFIPHPAIPWHYNPSPGVHSKYVRVIFEVTQRPEAYKNNAIQIDAIDWFGEYPANTKPAEIYTWDFDKKMNLDGQIASTGGIFTGAYSTETTAPIVARNTNAYASPWTQYSQIWQDNAGSPMAWIRNDGTFYIGGSQGQMRASKIELQATGSASLPALYTIQNSADADTGMYFPAADNIGFSTGAGQRLRLNSSGAHINGSIYADNYYSGDGTQGYTSAGTVYICTDATCTTKLACSIKDGLITGCV